MKDDSGSYAVFTEQGSSASQMTAAKVMTIISRPPGCAGQAADAKKAYTQVKMEDAPTLLNIPKSECPDMWIRLPTQKNAEIMVQYGIRQDYCVKGNLRTFYWNMVGEKVANGNVCSLTTKKGLFLSVYVDDIKLAGKKQNINPTWKF